ncbi:hypothetical protein [Dactylosporangium sp. CA-233914]|uniref:hypothetical protein n=1 Tax=Dactylosporangium sp. CA-233914 TaxID=3239934 RepID=UPI003D89B8B4
MLFALVAPTAPVDGSTPCRFAWPALQASAVAATGAGIRRNRPPTRRADDLARRATHDPLTGLGDRALLAERVPVSLRRLRDPHPPRNGLETLRRHGLPQGTAALERPRAAGVRVGAATAWHLAGNEARNPG